MFILFILVFGIMPTYLFATGSAANTAANGKQETNFFGTLTTYHVHAHVNGDKSVQHHQNHKEKLAVENISIENRVNQIPMYDMPDQENLPDITPKPYSNKEHVILDENPQDYTVTKIDLDETSSIHAVPSPVYIHTPERGQPAKYIEVHVVSNKSNTKHSYLINKKTRIHCDEKNAAGPIEKQIPIYAVDMLTIEGFVSRSAQAPNTLPSKNGTLNMQYNNDNGNGTVAKK